MYRSSISSIIEQNNVFFACGTKMVDVMTVVLGMDGSNYVK